LCSKGLERQLRARGEDLREFWPLHRDLIAIFQPQGEAAVRAVEWLARTWWEKARRIRHWVAAGPARSEDLNARLDELLRFLVHLLRQRHEWWQHRLVSVLELPLGSPADVRRRSSRGCSSSAEPSREGGSTLAGPPERKCSRNSRKSSVESWQAKRQALPKGSRQKVNEAGGEGRAKVASEPKWGLTYLLSVR
jgi:hypothetical protein